MILKGSQRSGGWALANHLMNDQDNDHVILMETRGFVGETLHEALDEAHVISKATRCEKYLYSLSVNPPPHHIADEDELISAIERAENALGLDDQPRAIVIHEKEGRRHAHVVWSRIDADKLKAVQISHDKRKLMSLSKELFLDHGWELPKGLQAYGGRNPLNFTLAEWQQVKRLGVDPREIKQSIRECWERSDGKAGFVHALEDRGLFLARGDRRGFVVLDVHGQVYSLSRWSGVTAKNIKTRLGPPDALPDVSEVRNTVLARAKDTVKTFIADTRTAQDAELAPLNFEKAQMVSAHRSERTTLKHAQEKRWIDETKTRQAKLNGGLKGVFDWISGKARQTRKENEQEAYFCLKRDQHQRHALVDAQMQERQNLQQKFISLRKSHKQERASLARDIGRYLKSFGERKQRFNGPVPNNPSKAFNTMRERNQRDRSHGPDLSL
mmetsp:Transcript_23889/g.43381  ORF Transcript_23889/g.43381 Transcript_23889/m.43381 type:complete len:442 (+) Transcript_23889:255-1580(+)